MNAQTSTLDQLKEMWRLAIKAGLYDGADWLSTQIGQIENPGHDHYVDSDGRCVHCDEVIVVEGDAGHCMRCT